MLSTDLKLLLAFMLAAPSLSPAVAQTALEIQPAAVSVPDSVRRKVGYQHWTGAVLGGAVGATTGLVLAALTNDGSCADCIPSNEGGLLLKAAAVGTGIGSALGLLIGAASPKYRWYSRGPDDPAPPPQAAARDPLDLPSVQVPRGDYRYEGLAIGGIPLAILGAYMGSRTESACPTVPGADCTRGSVGDAITLGLVGGAIGGGIGYVIGRLSPKEPGEPAR